MRVWQRVSRAVTAARSNSSKQRASRAVTAASQERMLCSLRVRAMQHLAHGSHWLMAAIESWLPTPVQPTRAYARYHQAAKRHASATLMQRCKRLLSKGLVACASA